jgi:hypothetical protein
MRKDVLKKEQVDLLPLLKLFSKDFYFVGGTAIALHIGHRYSIDFDLFTYKNIKRKSIKNLLEKNNYIIQDILFEDSIQLHCIINDVKVNIFQFPHRIEADLKFKDIIKIPDLLTLSAMKAYDLCETRNWKHYVDLFYILKHYHTFEQISSTAKLFYGELFNDKLFRQQLSYFDDVDFIEEIEFLGDPIPESEIKEFLTEIALTPF